MMVLHDKTTKLKVCQVSIMAECVFSAGNCILNKFSVLFFIEKSIEASATETERGLGKRATA